MGSPLAVVPAGCPRHRPGSRWRAHPTSYRSSPSRRRRAGGAGLPAAPRRRPARRGRRAAARATTERLTRYRVGRRSAPSPTARRAGRRARRQRAALRGDVPVRPRRRDIDAQAVVGRDRRLDRRRRRRRHVELPRAHQRHRGGDRDRARPRRPAAPDPGHRPVRGGADEHAHREAAMPAPPPSRRPAGGHVRGGRRQQRTVSPNCSASSACRASSPAARPSTRRPPSCSPRSRRQRRPGHRAAENKNIIPVAEQLDALTAKHVGRAHPSMPDAGRPGGLRPGGPGRGQHRGDGQGGEAIATGEVTRAVRDTSPEAGAVADGDWIGIVRGDGIVAVAPTCSARSTTLLAVVTDAVRAGHRGHRSRRHEATTDAVGLARRTPRVSTSRCTTGVSRCTRTSSAWSERRQR